MKTQITLVLGLAFLMAFTSCLKDHINPRSKTIVSTFAGSLTEGSADGSVTAATFAHPTSLTFDATGNLYILDQLNCTIRKITPSGIVTTLAGSGNPGFADGQGTAAKFNYPSGLAIDASGYLYVADGLRVRKVSPTGVVTTLAGNATAGAIDGQGTAASFYEATDVALDASGNVYVADFLNFKIRKITTDGLVSTFAGSGVHGSANGRGTAASFDSPNGLAIDAAGNVYVAEEITNQIRKITPSGFVTTFAGSTARGSNDGSGLLASFYYPKGMAFDASGNLYVADNGSDLIRKITPQAYVSTIAGNGVEGFANGNGSSASFNRPADVVVDPSGNVFVADAFNNMIRKIEFK